MSDSEALSSPLDMPPLEKLEVMYSQVLDHLLTPAHVKAQLIESQSAEKKWQTVKMSMSSLSGGGAGGSTKSKGGWGATEKALLNSIDQAKFPDIPSLNKLKVILSSGNRACMNAFLSAGGVSVIFKSIKNRLRHNIVSELDAATLHAMLAVLIVVMNNSIGMDKVFDEPFAFNTVARCLSFKHKVFAMQVLEILTVCCFYSELGATMVVEGLRHAAEVKQEPPFAQLSKALLVVDIEVKHVIMKLVNGMIVGIEDESDHAQLRAEIDAVDIGSKCDIIIEAVRDTFPPQREGEEEMGAAAGDSTHNSNRNGTSTGTALASLLPPPPPPLPKISSASPTSSSSSSGGDKRRSRVLSKQQEIKKMSISLFGNAEIDADWDNDYEGGESPTENDITSRPTLTPINRSTSALSAAGQDAARFNTRIVSGHFEVQICPSAGKMAGLCYLPKTEKIYNIRVPSNVKERWVELNQDCLGWYSSTEKPHKEGSSPNTPLPAEFTTKIPISSISEVRSYCSKSCVNYVTPHAFEVVVVPVGGPSGPAAATTHAIGCRTEEDKDKWLVALQAARDAYLVNTSAYRVQYRELSLNEARKYANSFVKQANLYHSLTNEDRQATIAHCGVDINDVTAVSQFLQSEMMTHGLSGKLLLILQEFLLVPSGNSAVWDVIYSGVRKVRAALQANNNGNNNNNNNNSGNTTSESYNNDDSDSDDDGFDNSNLVSLLAAKQKENKAAGFEHLNELALAALTKEQEVEQLRDALCELQEELDDKREEIDRLKKAGMRPMSMNVTKSNALATTAAAAAAKQNAQVVTTAAASVAAAAEEEVTALMLKIAEMEESATSYQKRIRGLDDRVHELEALSKQLTAELKLQQDNVASAQKEIRRLKVKEVLRAFATKSKTDRDLASAAAAASTAAAEPVPVNNEKYVKYDKMRKMLPEGAVRQKMMADGLAADEIDAYFKAPPGETPGTTTPSSPAVNEKYVKYDKMRKMLPEGAVRQKMMADGLAADEIDAYFKAPLGETPGTTTPSSPAVNEKYVKYDKMRKMLPEGAVRQKMATDGLAADEIDAYFKAPLGGASSTVLMAVDVAAPPAPVVNEKYVKYDKMRKMLPEGAVRQKMMSDGISSAEIDAYFKAPIGEAPVVADCTQQQKKPVVDEKYAKYEKMRKAMLPEAAVRQKMMSDGLLTPEIDAYFELVTAAGSSSTSRAAGAGTAGAAGAGASGGGASAAAVAKMTSGPPPAAVPDDMSAKAVVKRNTKVKGLFWTKVAVTEIKGTVWHKLDEFQLPSENIQLADQWFGVKPPPSSAKPVGAADTGAGSTATGNVTGSLGSGGGGDGTGTKPAVAPKAKLISVLDGKRTQNLAIVVQKLRKAPEVLMQQVVDLDTVVCNLEFTTTMLSIMPTPEEFAAVKAHSDASKLDKASALVFHLNRVPRVLQRLQCHEICFNWMTHCNQTCSQMLVISKACDEMSKSQQAITKLLSIILSIGNYLNGETSRGQAYGIKLDIFNKMCALKATTPSQGTLMHFLAHTVQSTEPELLLLSEKWVAIWAAAQLSLRDIQRDLGTLESQFNKINQEFLRIKDGEENPGLDGKMETSKGPTIAPLWKRLDNFLQTTRPKLVACKEQYKTLEDNVEKTANYYSESLKTASDEDSCQKFFKSMSDFAKAYKSAIDDNVRKRLVEERKRRVAAEQEAKAAAARAKKLAGTVSAAASSSSSSPAPMLGSSEGSASGKRVPSRRIAKAKSKRVPSEHKENIFESFHTTEDDAEVQLAKFRLKLHSKSIRIREKSARLTIALEDDQEGEEEADKQ